MEIFYRIAFTIIIAFVCTLLFIYYQIKDAVKYQNLSISSIRKIEIQLQNAKIFIEVISVSFGIERLVTLHVDNVHFEIKKAAAKADSVPVNITTITSIYNILLAAGNITAVRWFSEIGQLKCTDIVISGQEKDIALSIKQLVLVAARANSLDEAANIFKEGTTRLYSISVQLSRIAVVKNEDLQVLETIERALLSLVLSNHPKTSIMQVGLLISTSFININVDKLYGACNGNQNLRDFELEEESLAEKLQDFFILDFPRLSPLAKFVPSIAVIVPKLTISVPVRLGNIKTTAKLVFENCALILITNPLNPLQASIHAKLEHGAVDVLPLQRRFFTFSLISFWNEINIVNARNTLYPTFLPYRVDFDSFLTVTNPVLMVEEATILEFLGEAGKNNETSGNNSRFFQFSDSSFLESLFRIKVRMHLLNYTLGENLKSLKDKYCLSMTGNEFGFTLESLDKDNGQTSGSHGMLNLILDAAEISVSCVKQGNTPPKSSLISSPSVLVTMAMSSDFQMEVFLVLHSLVFNLESIYEEIAEFENFVFFVTGKFGPFLKSKTTTKHYSPLRDCVKLVLHAQLDDFLFIAGSVHPPHHATRIIGKKMAAKFVKNEKEFLSQYEIGGFLIQSAPHNYSIENIIDWKDIHFKQKGVGGLIVGSSKDLHLNVDLSKAFVLIKTGEMFMRLSNSFLKALVNPLTNGLGEISAERRAGANRSVGFAFKIPQVYLNVTLPESVKGIAVFSAVDVKFYNSRLDVTIKSFHSSVFKETEKQMVELAILNEIVIQISSATVTKPMIVIFNSALSRLIIPNDWPFANIVENGINLSRAVKHLFFECMQKDPPKYFASGDSFLLPAETPSFFVKSKYTEIVIVDNHFESSLGRNYKIGYDENLLRINREKEFMKKAKSKFPAMSRSDYNDLKRLLHMQKFPKGAVAREVFTAWSLLQEFNSRSYLKLFSKFGDEILPPLLKTVIHDLEVDAIIPTLAMSLERTLHEMDENTPPNLIYDDLIARNVKMTFTSLSSQLRDYSNPLMYMPRSSGSYFVMEGLIVIADPESPPQCKRAVAMTLDFDDELTLVISRNANPTKTYMQTNMHVQTDSVVRICLGAPFEPCLADVITVLDNFTKVSEDASPPIGWWDKMRVIFHGTNSLKLSGSGKINVLILGSASPYYDPRKNYGIEGLEWSFSNGLDIVFGPKSENSTKLDMVVECGELKLTMPRSLKHCLGSPEVCFAKLTGGVRMVLSCDFKTVSPADDTLNIQPWRKHHELTLLPGESFRNSTSAKSRDSYDSYYGFRSKSIQIYLDICSPKENYSSLTDPQNCLFLNSETIEGISKLSMVYQSLLTNVPVKRGNLFNTVAVALKPKLGREINSVCIKTLFRPLMLSFILDCEDGEQSAGMRLRCEQMDWTAQFRQYDVKLVSEAVLDKKPVTKWIRESSFISFIEVEGRVVSYCYPDSDLSLPTKKNVKERENEMTGWVFNEDVAVFKEFANLSLLPCVWAPKLDFLALENGKQTQETEDSASKGNLHFTLAIFDVQYQIFRKRLEDIDAEIAMCNEKHEMSTFRDAVFFNDTKGSSYVAELSILKEKRKVISASIAKCERILRNGGNLVGNLGFENEKFVKARAFDSKYIVHNARLLWNGIISS